MDPLKVKKIIEAALVCADGPMTLDSIVSLFTDEDFEGGAVDKELVNSAIEAFAEDCEDRGVELKKVASGYRLQVRQELSAWVSRMWEEKPPRYTRALLETLSLVAYKQPVTRGDIEQVRGVAVSTNIMRTLVERNWVRIVGHREVPGRPAMYGTTRAFLDYFNLSSLSELPPLADIRALTDPVVTVEDTDFKSKKSLELPDESSPEGGLGQEELGLEISDSEESGQEMKMADIVVLPRVASAQED